MPRLTDAILAAALASALVRPAAAEFQVRSPVVEYREIELEHNGATTFDRRKSGLSNNQSYTYEIGVGVLPWWSTALEGETEAPSGSNLRYRATTWENVFALAPQGALWADVALFAELSHDANRNAPDSVVLGPLVAKETGDFLHTVNLLFGRTFGLHHDHATSLEGALQSRWQGGPFWLQPGVEYYAAIADIGRPGKPADQEHRIGPVAVGKVSFDLGRPVELGYEVGYLFGLTRGTERGAVRWKMELGMPF